jgi:hypothetical protein
VLRLRLAATATVVALFAVGMTVWMAEFMLWLFAA